MLKRDISTINVLITAAGGMIGSAWLFVPYIGAQIAGPEVLISWMIALIFMLFVALPLCELGAMLPLAGGMANYPVFTHGREIGFLFFWVAWLSYVVMTPIEVQAVLQYGSHFFPFLTVKESSYFKLSHVGYVAAVVILLAAVLLNSYGIKFLTDCNKYASILKFVLPSVAILSFVHFAPSYENLHLNLATSDSWIRIFSALSAGGIAFAFTGFQNGLVLAGEVKNPQRDVPIAMLGALLIGFMLYFMLQFSFLVAIPKVYVQHGWQQLTFPGDNGPLVGLALILGLSIVAALLSFDAIFSPSGTALVYTAATSRIVYSMATNHYLPPVFLRLNRYKIPYAALYANFVAGLLSFLPFPGWQKMVAFLASASVLSYGIGPVCLLALRKLCPEQGRPFTLPASLVICYIAFCVCTLMLYWCGFTVLWKLYVAILLGFSLYLVCQWRLTLFNRRGLYWFFAYLTVLLAFSYLGSFSGIGLLRFPMDILLVALFSLLMLCLSQYCLLGEEACRDQLELTNQETS